MLMAGGSALSGMLCHPSSLLSRLVICLEPQLPQKCVYGGWMVCPWVPEVRHGQVTLPGWIVQPCSQVDQCPGENCGWPGQHVLQAPALLGLVVRRWDQTSSRSPKMGWQSCGKHSRCFLLCTASAGPSLGRGTGSQQTTLKHCTQRLVPSQTQKGRKRKNNIKKDWSTLESTERATHGEESCFQEPQG